MTLFSSSLFKGYSLTIFAASLLFTCQTFAMLSDDDTWVQDNPVIPTGTLKTKTTEATSSGSLKVASSTSSRSLKATSYSEASKTPTDASEGRLSKRPSLQRSRRENLICSNSTRKTHSENDLTAPEPANPSIQTSTMTAEKKRIKLETQALIDEYNSLMNESSRKAYAQNENESETTTPVEKLASLLVVNCDYLIDKKKITECLQKLKKREIKSYLEQFANCRLTKDGTERPEKERISNQRYIAQAWYKKYCMPDWYITPKWYN